MPSKPRKGSKAERSAEKKMTPEETRSKIIKDAADFKKKMDSKSKRLIEETAHYKRKLAKYDYMEEASELVTHKFKFDINVSDFQVGAYEGDAKPFLDGSIGTVFLTHKMEQKNASGKTIAVRTSPTLWKNKKHSHRVTFLLNKELTKEMTMKIKISMYTKGRFAHNMRNVMTVNHGMLPDEDFDEPHDEDFNKRWEIYFTPEAEEIKENYDSPIFSFQVRATQLKIK